jgi:glycosyltransferase involved in cell wall biosynthesis
VIERVVVVIPARDEEERIGRCLASVARAARLATVRVQTVVVADGCLDRTAALARSFRGVRVIELESSNVGASRRRGALGLDAATTWIANTDADSVVPPNWISAQVELANRGWDVVVGTVRPEFSELSAEQLEAWHRTHPPGEANGHVHGANLGVRASAYAAVGGYRRLPEHEDNDLVERLSDYRIVATDDCPVTTSGRSVGRTPGGYAKYLREELLTAALADAS